MSGTTRAPDPTAQQEVGLNLAAENFVDEHRSAVMIRVVISRRDKP